VPDGWLYDIKRWSSPFDLRLPTLPKLENQPTQGVPEDYFKSGTESTDDIFLNTILHLTGEKTKQWVPELSTGDYYRYNTGYHLFSDNSIVEYLTSGNTLALSKEPKVNSTILAATFKREKETSSIVYHKKISEVISFSGKWVDGEEQETLTSGGTIVWANVDTTKREFVHTYPNTDVHTLVFNKDYIETHGVVPALYHDLGACEHIGSSNGRPYQVFTLKYFPVIADASFHLYVAGNTTWTPWARAATWKEMEDTVAFDENKCFLDKDLGIIYFGNSFCGVPPTNTKIVVSYSSTLRIEYEEELENLSITAWDADINPITQATSQGFVCITHKLLEAANITLAVNKSAIRSSSPKEYGPVYAGSDYAIFTAKVTNANGEVVPGVEVKFEMTPTNLGALNNATSSISATNSLGKAYTNYQPPTTSNDLGWFSMTTRASTDYPTYKEVIIKNKDAGLNGKEDKVYLYHVFKDDPILGYKDLDAYLDAIYALNPVPWVENAVDPVEAKAKWRSEMILQYDLSRWEDDAGKEGTLVSGRKVIVYKIDYANDTDNTDATAVNPITGLVGTGTKSNPVAIMPVFPTVAEQLQSGDPYAGFWRLVYPAAAIPDLNTNPTGTEYPNESIAGYWIVSDRLITVKASCWSPYYNKTIYSNPILLRIAIPDYMLGIYVRDDLKKVPIGWQLEGTDSIASMLNTSTFITINPYCGPYEIIDLVNQETTDTWASAPFRTVNFSFEVIEE
jgi:hypothetical protein